MPEPSAPAGRASAFRTAEHAFLGLVALLGLVLHGDYGVPWDETYQRPYGQVVHAYVLYGDTALSTHHDRFHGPLFEFTLVAAEKALGLTDSRSIHLLRHIGTFALFWAAVAALMALARRVLLRPWAPLLAGMLLVLMPRIFAEAFYNTKDLAFLSLHVIAMLTMVRFLEKPSVERGLVHALACAALIALRILGVLVPALTVALLAVEWWRRRTERTGIFDAAAAFVAATPLLTILFWPALWERPVHSFWEAARQMGNFPWDLGVRYLGEYVPASQLPWHYIPVWVAATMPEATLVLAVCGIPPLAWRMLRGPWQVRRGAITALAWLFLPLLMVMLMRPVVYDGWRHLYFIAPALALLAAAGAEWMSSAVDRFPAERRKAARTALAGLLALPLLLTAAWMVRYHPQQQVYFSPLVGGIRGAAERFELDYWGLSYRQALEELLRRDTREKIRISVENDPGRLNAEILPEADRKRLEYVDRKDADYHLTNHRWHYGEQHGGHLFGIEVQGVEILGVYKAKEY